MLKVGTVVRLKVPLLGNDAGVLGVCYEVYDHGWGRGVSVIFENGNYDGFGPEEQEPFLEVVKESNLYYNFQNVMTLSNDFSRGVFNEVLDITDNPIYK